MLLKLTPYLANHALRSLGYAAHGERAEQERQHTAQQQADYYERVKYVYHLKLGSLRIGYEQGHCRKRRGADGEALAHGGGGVANAVKAVGNVAHAFLKAGHFGYAARVIGYRAVCIDRNGHARGGEHAYRRKRYAVKPGELICAQYAKAHKYYGNAGGKHAGAEAANYVGRAAGGGLLGNALYEAVFIGGVNLGEEAYRKAHYKAADYCKAGVYAAEAYKA